MTLADKIAYFCAPTTGPLAVPTTLQPVDTAEAYAILDAVHARRRQAGDRQLGYKVGCTNAQAQDAMRVDGPIWAGLFASGRYESIEAGLAAAQHPVGVECEIALTVSSDFAGNPAGLDTAAVADHVAGCAIACELLENRFAALGTTSAASLIAGNFLQFGFITGPPLPDWRNLALADLAAEVRIDGSVVARGHSSAVMGHPLQALKWLACQLYQRGRQLRAGDLVLTGSLASPYWLDPALGVVELSVSQCGNLR